MKTYYEESNIKNIKRISTALNILPDYCFDYFISIENNTSSLTRLNYAKDLEVFFNYLSLHVLNKGIKDITLKDINQLKTLDIEKYLNYVSCYEINGKLRQNTERGKARKLASLRSFFKFLYNKEKIESNVISRIDSPKIHSKPIVRLEVDEVVKILNEAENQNSLTAKQKSLKNCTSVRDVAILSLLLGTGIRVSECVGLNIKDIDLENNAFKVVRKGGNQVVLYFSSEVKDALTKYLAQRLLIIPEEKCNAFFLSLQKKRITVRAVENIVKKYALVCSPLKKISPHKLRSTYGTNLYHETQDIYVVAEVLGHKDVNTTKRYYAAISEDIRRNAANKVKLR